MEKKKEKEAKRKMEERQKGSKTKTIIHGRGFDVVHFTHLHLLPTPKNKESASGKKGEDGRGRNGAERRRGSRARRQGRSPAHAQGGRGCQGW